MHPNEDSSTCDICEYYTNELQQSYLDCLPNEDVVSWSVHYECRVTMPYFSQDSPAWTFNIWTHGYQEWVALEEWFLEFWHSIVNYFQISAGATQVCKEWMELSVVWCFMTGSTFVVPLSPLNWNYAEITLFWGHSSCELWCYLFWNHEAKLKAGRFL